MMDKVDMSLDDIIKQSQKGRPRGGGGIGRKFASKTPRGKFRGSRGGGIGRQGRSPGNIRSPFNRSSGDIDSQWQHDMFDGFSAGGRMRGGGGGGAMTSGSSKLIVSNLDFGVSDADITELFSEFGNLKTAAIHYDRSGRSLGVADVIFDQRSDAMRALKQYDGVPLDRRPMRIRFADEGTNENRGPVRRSQQQPQTQQRSQPFRRGGAPLRGNRGRGGAGRGGGRGRGGQRQSNVTAEQLDAELDAYTNEFK